MKKILVNGLLIVSLTLIQPSEALTRKDLATIWLGTAVVVVSVNVLTLFMLYPSF